MGAHVPVLLSETIDALAVRPGGTYVDGTLGRAGHAHELLRRGAGRVVGIDRDAEAIEAVQSLAIPHLETVRGRHGDIAGIARRLETGPVDGVLLDLGVSSPQLDVAERGFSFRADGPLDMRMDRDADLTAAKLLATASVEELTGIFREYGEEPNARRIAKAIARERERVPIAGTLQLAAVVERTVPRHGPRHPATRVFQALRMAVNDEAGELVRALEGALGILRTGGRMAVITFESITDRIVKRFFAEHAGREESLQSGGSRWRGTPPRVRLVNRRAVTASAAEIAANARSRSAKLRAAEKLESEKETEFREGGK